MKRKSMKMRKIRQRLNRYRCQWLPARISREMKSSFLLLLFISNSYIPVVYTQELDYGVARSIPFTDTGISGDPVVEFSTSSRIYCLVQCRLLNCSSFNFGNNTCELYSTYLCQGYSTLVSKAGFKYFDVEIGDFIPVRYI